MDHQSPLVTLADCFTALSESFNSGENPIRAIRRAADDMESHETVIAKRLGAQADAQLNVYFSLPQSRPLASQRNDLEQLVWSLLDVVRAIPNNHSYNVPSSIEIGTLRLVAQNIEAAGNASNDLTAESFDTLRYELNEIESELDDSSLDSNYVAAIRIQIRHLKAELDSIPVDADAVISKASALIGMLAICARNSTGESQNKFVRFLKKAMSAITFNGFTSAAGEIASDLALDAIESVFEGTVVAPGSSDHDDSELSNA